MWGMMEDHGHSSSATYISSERPPNFEMDRLFMFRGYGETPAAPPKNSFAGPLGHADTQFRGFRQSRGPSFDVVDYIAAAPN